MLWRITYRNENDEKNILRCLTGTKARILRHLGYLLDIGACTEVIWIDRLTNPKWETIKRVIKGQGLWIHFHH